MTKEEFINMMRDDHNRACANAHQRMIEAEQIKLLYEKMNYDKRITL